MKITITTCLILLFSIALSSIMLRSHATVEDDLMSLLSDPTCNRACFLTIEPGVTTKSELEVIVSSNNIEVYSINGFDPDNASWSLLLEEPIQFLGPSSSETRLIVALSDGVVNHVLLPLYVDTQVVYSTYGNPDRVGQVVPEYYLEYAVLGLIFGVDTQISNTHTDFAILTPQPIVNGQLEYGFSNEYVDEPCPTYGEPPCIAPTRLPNQAPTVTISYGFSFVEQFGQPFPNPVMINVNNEFYTDDPDGDALTYEWRITYPSSRAGVVYAGSDASVTLNIGAPHNDYCNPMVLQLTATDPYGASASDTTTVSFVPLNTTGQCVPEF